MPPLSPKKGVSEGDERAREGGAEYSPEEVRWKAGFCEVSPENMGRVSENGGLQGEEFR